MYGDWKVLSLVAVLVVSLALGVCAVVAPSQQTGGAHGHSRQKREDLSKILDGLRTLSKTMHEHSGIDNGLEDWLDRTFGQWKTLIVSLLISLAVFTAILVTCGCCCVPCIRSLMVRLIATTTEGKAPPPYMLPLSSTSATDGDGPNSADIRMCKC